MGEPQRREIERVRASQNWNLHLTFGEVWELRQLLLSRHTKDQKTMDRNNDALEAIDGETNPFVVPRGLDTKAQMEWLQALQARVNLLDRSWWSFTIDNIETILEAMDWCAANGVILNEKGERIVLMDGAKAYRLRHAKKRLRAAIDDKPTAGEAEPAEVKKPAG